LQIESSCRKKSSAFGQQLLHAQRFPAKERIERVQHWRLKQERHALNVLVHQANLVGGQKQQGAAVQRSQIDLVKQAFERIRTLVDLRRQCVEHFFHLLAVVAAHDDDHVIVVAEFLHVLPPALEVFLIAADKIVALGEAGKIAASVESASCAREQNRGEDEPRLAADDADDAGQRAREQTCRFPGFRIH
jgi:hypothetical protein